MTSLKGNSRYAAWLDRILSRRMDVHNSNLRSHPGKPSDLLSLRDVEYNGINDVDHLAAHMRILGSSGVPCPFLEPFNMPEYSCRTGERGARIRLHVVTLRREPCFDQESQNGRTNSAA